MDYQELLTTLADHIASRASREPAHPLRVAFDGIDASGKTTLADNLVQPLEARGIPVIRASIDGFHRPRVERYRQGAESPMGYYEDSFDYAALRDALLGPLGPGGSLHYRRAVFDYHVDEPALVPEEEAPPEAVLLFDGVFLQRPELDGFWDYLIFVAVDEVVAVRRAMQRDLALFGTAEAVLARYLRRYMPAQRFYIQTVHPRDRADVIVENNNPAQPRLVFNTQRS